MAANQVVLYFAKQEDALLFTLAASSVMSAKGSVRGRRRSGQGSGGDLQSQSDHD